jgi:hypothetical protein
MPPVSTGKIITNRQLNFTLSPVDTHNAKSMPHKLQNYEIDGTWNQHQSIILDAILDRYFHAFYRNYSAAPQSWRSPKVIKSLQHFQTLINPETIAFMTLPQRDAFIRTRTSVLVDQLQKQYDNSTEKLNNIDLDTYTDTYFKNDSNFNNFCRDASENMKLLFADNPIKIDLNNFFDRYPFLHKYRYTFKDYLHKISNTKFKMSYKLKYIAEEPAYNKKGKMIKRGQLVDLNYQMQEFQSLFGLDFDGDNPVLNFNRPLGKFVLHNSCLLDTDWCPIEATKLSKNAYFIYKRFVLNRQSGKHKADSIVLKLDEIGEFLDLRWSNGRGINAIIDKALDDLAGHGLICGWESSKRFGGQRTYLLNFGNANKKIAGTGAEELKVM